MRMRIPQMLNDQDEFNVTPKTDDDQMMGRPSTPLRTDNNDDPKATAMKSLKRLGKPLQVNIDWSLYTKNYESVEKELLLANISGILLQAKSQVSPDIIKQYADNSGRDNFIKTATLQIMSTPEYQLC
jgi:ABC-type branched-subunit amino acid transport system substrate-binding protein